MIGRMSPTFAGIRWRWVLPAAVLTSTLPNMVVEKAAGDPPQPLMVQGQGDTSVKQVLDRMVSAEVKADEVRPKELTTKQALELLPTVNRLHAALKADTQVSPETLDTIGKLCDENLYFWPMNIEQRYKEGGKPFTLAVLDLMDTVVEKMMAVKKKDPRLFKKEGLDSRSEVLRTRLAWIAGRYHGQAEVQKKATEILVRHFLNEHTVATLYDTGFNPTSLAIRDPRYSPMPWVFNVLKEPWLVKMEGCLKALQAEALTTEQRMAQYHTMNEHMAYLTHVYGASKALIPAEIKTAITNDITTRFLQPYAAYLKTRLSVASDFEERKAIGRALGRGVQIEGEDSVLRTIHRRSLSWQDAVMHPPHMYQADRYGGLGPFSTMLLDLDRVVYTGDADHVGYRHYRNKEKKLTYEERVQFNHNAITAYLVSARILSGERGSLDFKHKNMNLIEYVSVLKPADYLVGLMTHRFRTALEQDLYRKLLPPAPAIWGEHMAMFYQIDRGRPAGVHWKAYYQQKQAVIDTVFLRGQTVTSVWDDKPVAQEPIFDLYRWRMQYVMLKEKGVADPHKQKDAAQQWIDKPEFQKELARRVAVGYAEFLEAFKQASPKTKRRDDPSQGFLEQFDKVQDFSQSLAEGVTAD